MPIVKINLKKGQSKESLISLMDCIHEEMVHILNIPEDDKNIRVMEYEPELFVMKPPYEMLIEIVMFSGRKEDTKAKLYKAIVENLRSKLSVDPQTVFIVVNEQQKENWGLQGGISASNISFDFNVEV